MGLDPVREPDAVLGQEILLAGGMDTQHEHHRGILITLKGDVVPCADFQSCLQRIYCQRIIILAPPLRSEKTLLSIRRGPSDISG
jgi:hypothetical protein